MLISRLTLRFLTERTSAETDHQSPPAKVQFSLIATSQGSGPRILQGVKFFRDFEMQACVTEAPLLSFRALLDWIGL